MLWQLLCGINGASDRDQAQAVKAATALAVELRRKALGNYEPCAEYTPPGSHIRRTEVYSRATAHREITAATKILPFCGDPTTALALTVAPQIFCAIYL